VGKIRGEKPSQGGRLQTGELYGTGSTQLLPVRFSFTYFNSDCIAHCNLAHFKAFADRLKLLSGVTWQQITSANRHGIGHEKIRRDQLKCPCALADDVEFVLAFRYHGMCPMLGHREGAILHVLWLDPNFQAYDHD
jgi:hypothetical protein